MTFAETPGGTTVTISSDADIVTARRQGRTFVLQLGFSSPEAMVVATAISELARNIIMYATSGEIVLRPVEHEGKPGVLVIARDQGPGMSEMQRAALSGCSPASAVCHGLHGLKRLVDECVIVSQTGQGTTISVTKWRQAL